MFYYIIIFSFAILLHIFTLGVFYSGKCSGTLSNAIYNLWFAISFGDLLTSCAALIIQSKFFVALTDSVNATSYLCEDALMQKWIGFSKFAFAWYPTHFLHVAVALYRLYVFERPLKYYQLQRTPKWQRIWQAVVGVCVILGILVGLPLATANIGFTIGTINCTGWTNYSYQLAFESITTICIGSAICIYGFLFVRSAVSHLKGETFDHGAPPGSITVANKKMLHAERNMLIIASLKSLIYASIVIVLQNPGSILSGAEIYYVIISLATPTLHTLVNGSFRKETYNMLRRAILTCICKRRSSVYKLRSGNPKHSMPPLTVPQIVDSNQNMDGTFLPMEHLDSKAGVSSKSSMNVGITYANNIAAQTVPICHDSKEHQ